MQDEVADTGLMMMGHRFYAPDHGRFLNRDPIGFRGGANLFEYAASSPVQVTDAAGLAPGDLWTGEQHAVFTGDYAGNPSAWTVVHGPRPSSSYSPPPAEDISLLDPNLVKALKGHAKRWGLPEGALLGLFTVAGGYSMFGGGSGRGFGRRGGQRGFARIGRGTRPTGAPIEIVNGQPCTTPGFVGPINSKGRQTRGGGNAVNLSLPDGSYLDISGERVKAGVPNTHPNAPPGTINQVHWANPQTTPTGKVLLHKRDPFPEELSFLNGFFTP